jgi:hypothetical protein
MSRAPARLLWKRACRLLAVYPSVIDSLASHRPQSRDRFHPIVVRTAKLASRLCNQRRIPKLEGKLWL